MEGNSSPYLATVINTSSLSLLLIYTWQGGSPSLFYKWLGAAVNHDTPISKYMSHQSENAVVKAVLWI